MFNDLTPSQRNEDLDNSLSISTVGHDLAFTFSDILIHAFHPGVSTGTAPGSTGLKPQELQHITETMRHFWQDISDAYRKLLPHLDEEIFNLFADIRRYCIAENWDNDEESQFAGALARLTDKFLLTWFPSAPALRVMQSPINNAQLSTIYADFWPPADNPDGSRRVPHTLTTTALQRLTIVSPYLLTDSLGPLYNSFPWARFMAMLREAQTHNAFFYALGQSEAKMILILNDAYSNTMRPDQITDSTFNSMSTRVDRSLTNPYYIWWGTGLARENDDYAAPGDGGEMRGNLFYELDMALDGVFDRGLRPIFWLRDGSVPAPQLNLGGNDQAVVLSLASIIRNGMDENPNQFNHIDRPQDVQRILIQLLGRRGWYHYAAVTAAHMAHVMKRLLEDVQQILSEVSAPQRLRWQRRFAYWGHVAQVFEYWSMGDYDRGRPMPPPSAPPPPPNDDDDDDDYNGGGGGGGGNNGNDDDDDDNGPLFDLETHVSQLAIEPPKPRKVNVLQQAAIAIKKKAKAVIKKPTVG